MTATARQVTYHFYAGESMRKVAEYLLDLGEPAPNPLLSVAWTAEDEEGNIRAVAVIQSVPLAEPFTAQPGWGFTLQPLFDEARKFVMESGAPRLLAHTAWLPMQRALQAEGARPIADVVYDWRRPVAAEGAE